MNAHRIVHAVLTALLLLAWAVAGILLGSGAVELRWTRPAPVHEEPPPLPVGAEGAKVFSHEKDAPRRANETYPAWLRGNGPNGWADDRSRYYYTQLVGPSNAELRANRLLFGTLVLKPGATYPAHSHPAAEVYFILDGEAEWCVDGKSQMVTPGSAILHRPRAMHGWRNTSDKDLKAVWVWWAEEGTPDVLTKGATLFDPNADEKTAKPCAGR